MEQKINVDNLDDLQKQALVCMYYAMLPKTDARYKQRMHDWEVLEKRFGTKKTTYKHAKDAPYIGPELSRDPSQALSTLDMIKAVAVIRAVLDEFPEMLGKFKEIFDREFMDRVLGAVTVMIPTSVKFGDSKEDAVNSIQEEMSIENEGSEEEEMESNT